MPFVVYVAPFFSENATRNIAALLDLPGVRLGAIGQEPQEALATPLRERLVAHWRVDDALDGAQLLRAARALAERQGPIARLLSATEQVQEQLAAIRVTLGIAGMDPEATRNFRDKARMKALLRAADLPCARYRLAPDAATAWDFAREIGYPLVVKPPAGAGAQATYRADDDAGLQQILDTLAPGPGRAALLEEFITGAEHSFDTWCIGGRPVFHSLTEYLPTPLDAMRNPWIQWAVLLPREVDDSRYDDIRAAAFAALATLGMGSGLSHLEWFRRADGSLAISEVAARPPGAQITTLISRAHDFDSLAAWAELMVYDRFTPPTRRYAAGAAFLRGQGRGTVRATHGLDLIERELGPLITDVKLPTVGQAPSISYEGEGFIAVRHPETAVVRAALARIVPSRGARGPGADCRDGTRRTRRGDGLTGRGRDTRSVPRPRPSGTVVATSLTGCSRSPAVRSPARCCRSRSRRHSHRPRGRLRSPVPIAPRSSLPRSSVPRWGPSPDCRRPSHRP